MPAKKQQASVLDELREATKREGGLYLTESEKDQIAADETPITFSEIIRTTSEFTDDSGAKQKRWECKTVLNGKDRVISIPSNDDRDKMMAALAKIAKRDGRVGPLVLTISHAKNGNRWYWLKPAE